MDTNEIMQFLQNGLETKYKQEFGDDYKKLDDLAKSFCNELLLDDIGKMNMRIAFLTGALAYKNKDNIPQIPTNIKFAGVLRGRGKLTVNKNKEESENGN